MADDYGDEEGYGFEAGEAKMAKEGKDLSEQSGYGGSTTEDKLPPVEPKSKESNTVFDMPRDSTGALTPQRVANPNSSRFTQTQADGFQTEIIGGGHSMNGYRQMNGLPGMNGAGQQMPPPGPGPQPLTRAESMQMQKLQNGVNTVQQQIATGEVSQQDGQRMMNLIKRQLGPLQQRQAQSRIQSMMQQNHDQQIQTGLADGLTNLRDQQLSKAFEQRIIDYRGADGLMHKGYLKHNGDMAALPSEEHRYKMRESNQDPRQIEQELAQGTTKEAREHHRHMADDYMKVQKHIREQNVDEHGNVKANVDLHKETMDFIRNRDLNLAEAQGKQAYIMAVTKMYPRAEDAPPEVREKMKKAMITESPLGGRLDKE